jgi:tetratricopeptide (TPR) repeat protein
VTFSIVNNIFCENTKVQSDSAAYYYLQSDYENALRIYLNLRDKNYSSAELFYNLGNCYFNTGDLANSIYFYEKAKLLNPKDADITNNLNVANSKLKNKIELLPEVFYRRWISSFSNLFSSDDWIYISITLFLLSLSLAGLYFFSRKISIRKLGFIFGILCLFLSTISLLFSSKQARFISRSNYAIVFETSLIKSSPAEESNNLFEINEGLKVEVIDSINSWSNIKLGDGKQGWITSKSIKMI